ncbi:MAG TPA: hypothetical protein VFO83_00185, partial [Aggregicoccus sp.]|nr:hypothetical protein [Aggregicoccus sp.]
MRNLLSALMCCWLLACAGAGPGDERGPGGPASAESPADAGPVDSQASYTYPGCANEDYNCPRLKTAYCALEAIRQKHDGSCARVEDCTLAALENDCTGSSSCGGLPIHVAGAAAFRAE